MNESPSATSRGRTRTVIARPARLRGRRRFGSDALAASVGNTLLTPSTSVASATRSKQGLGD